MKTSGPMFDGPPQSLQAEVQILYSWLNKSYLPLSCFNQI